MAIPNEFRYIKDMAVLMVDCKTQPERDFTQFNEKTYPVKPIWDKALRLLKSRGFSIGPDMEVDKLIRKRYHIGKKRQLEVCIHIYPMGMEIQFFQNVVFENRNGGRYDFDKYNRMPYQLKKQFELEARALMQLFFKNGMADKSRPICKTATEHIIQHFRSSSFTRNKITSLDEVAGMMSDYDHHSNSNDRDGKKIECGQTKYFRHRDGRLRRGVVYHNINNMWWVLMNNDYTNIASFYLFDAMPEDFNQRRLKKGSIPESRRIQLDVLGKISTKELSRQLRLRQKLQV